MDSIRDNVNVANEYVNNKTFELELIDELIEESESSITRMDRVLRRGSYKNKDQMVGIRDNIEEIYLNRLKKSRELIVKQMTAAKELRDVSYKALSDYEFANVAGRQGNVREFNMEDRIREMKRASYTFQELAALRT